MLQKIGYNLYFEIAIIPVDLVILIYVLKSYKEESESSYRFKIFASFVTISTSLDVVTSVIHSLGNSLPYLFRMIFNSIDCYVAFFTSFSFAVYMASFSGKGSIGKSQKILNYVINLIYTAIIIVNLFVPIAFSFDENGMYTRGPLYMILAFLFPLFYAFEGCLIAYRNKKKFTKIQMFCLRIALFETVFFFLLQMFVVKKTMLTFYTASLAMLILFLVLEAPESSKLNQVVKELEKARMGQKIMGEKLKIAIEVKAKFLTYLSHEMKTPINAILGYSEQIMSSNLDEATRKNAENIYGSATRLNKFFTSVIDEAITHNEYDKDTEVVFNSDGFDIVAHSAEGMPPGMRPPVAEEKSPVISSSSILSDSLHRFGYKRDSAQYKILCVDDNELNMELLLKILKNFGFTTDTAVNGLEAIDKVKKNSYDLILMDHMMPGMDGIDAMHILRNEGLCDLTPIIVVTANAVKGEKEKYLKEGFDSYVPKPFSGGSILRVIGKYLPVAMMDTLVRFNDSVGISRFMLASTFSRPVIAPDRRILVAGSNREVISRIARLLLTSLARIDVVYDGDECINVLSGNEYDMIFVDEDLKTRNGRYVKGFIWNNIGAPSIAIINTDSQKDPAIIYENFTDYIDSSSGPEVLDAVLLLYLPKNMVYVVGSVRYEKEDDDYYESSSGKSEDEDSYSIPQDEEVIDNPEFDPFAQEEDDYVLPDYVSGISGIDIDMGISNCGSGEGFVKALDIFASSASNKSAEIRKYYDEKDIAAYTIQVHALKSSARIIGAVALSELAFEMEQAGNNKDINLINEKTDTLLEMYEKIASEIVSGQQGGDDAEKIPADPAMLNDAYSSIYELGSMMDYDSIEMILGQLDQYSFDEADAKRIAKIKEGLEELNWDKVVSTAKEAL